MKDRILRNDGQSRTWHACGVYRREVLKSLVAAGASAMLPASRLIAQAKPPVTLAKTGRIDVHHHMLPPFYMNLRRSEVRGDARSENAATLSWTPARAVDEMDRNGIAMAMASLAVGGVSFNSAGEAARSLARKSNDYGAQLVKDYPGRFGLFAALPLPDQDGSLREIEYAFDVLKADGIALMTDYGEKWPGDPAFVPVFEELNRRKAIVFVHPTAPSCCTSLIPGTSGVWLEYLFDTARAITSFLVNGTLARFPDIRFIFCHSGGTMTVLAHRINEMLPKQPDRVPNGVLFELRKLYFDVANASNPSSLSALTKLVPNTQILFGSDYPFVAIESTEAGLDQFGLSKNDLHAVNRGNAERLFPRWKA